MASASLLALNASSGYLSLAAAKAGAGPNGMFPRPISATAPAPCRISRRVVENSWWLGVIRKSPRGRSPSKGLQEIHDRVDLLVGQNAISSERRHHGLRIALGLIVKDGDEFVRV